MAASSQIVVSLLLALADNVGAALMLALQRATAAMTVGFDASPEPPDVLLDELALLAVLVAAGAELLEELLALAGVLLLLLLPQPATNALLAAATASGEQSP